MFCKFCGNEIPPEEKSCPACGKKAETLGTGAKLVISIVCVLVLAAVLIVAVLFGTKGNDSTEPTETEPVQTTESAASAGYTVTDAVAVENANEVIATVGSTQLTNAQLQMLYRAEVYNFLNKNYYYLSYLGMDLTLPLEQQPYYEDATITWQDYFLDKALESWKSYAVLVEMANAEGYTFSEETMQTITDLEKTMQEEATAGGYASVEEMVKDYGGAGTNPEGFRAYQTVIYLGMDYFQTQYAAMTPTDEEIEAYYTEHAATYEEAGTGKDAGKTVDVRHILVQIAGGTTDESGNTVYSDQDWADCQAKAQKIYDQWKSGEATEDSFAKLADEVTEDPGSKGSGGLYQQVSAGQMITEFNDWIMDENRKVGDHGLVKTDYGYHIMYYSADEGIWFTTVKSDILSERFQTFYSSGEELYKMVVDYDKVVLTELKLS